MIPLPPKRFQKTQNPVFDQIRHKPWFHKLDARRAKIPFLEQAAAMSDITSQKNACESFSIDSRELRDYTAFIKGDSLIPSANFKTLQRIMDDAYASYCAAEAEKNIIWHLEAQARFYGMVKRYVTDFWETDSTYYPSSYPEDWKV